MNYRTSTSISALYGYLQEEACNELLDLSLWLNHGWPHAELKSTVVLLRRLLDSPDITQSELLAEGFSRPLLNKTLPLLTKKHVAMLQQCSSEASLNDRFDPRLPVMKVVNHGGYSIHRFSEKWMRVSSNSGNDVQEWMMLKKNNRIVGWLLMPHI
ncbi:hypothetical protein AB6E53_14575 [Vibrio breoganii]